MEAPARAFLLFAALAVAAAAMGPRWPAAGAPAVPNEPLPVDMRPFNPKTLPGPHPSTRQVVCLNGEWEFCPLYDSGAPTSDELMKLPALPASGWGTIRVPGKWKQVSGNEAVDAFGYPREWSRANRGWYRRAFIAPARSPGKRLKLRFNGVLVYCEVVVNGQSVGRHLGGVTPFELDITEAARPGAGNTLALYVVNERAAYIKQPAGRYDYTSRGPIYYSYSQGSAGIWQDVFLVTCPDVLVDSVAVRTSYRRREIAPAVELRNDGARDVPVTVAATVEALDGRRVRDLGRVDATAGAGAATHVDLKQAWPDARLWAPEDPYLYRLHTRVFAGGTLVDEHYQRFGFREFWIEGQKFLLNGRRITLFGDWTGNYGAGKDACLRPEYARAYIKHLKGMNYCGTRLQTIGAIPAALDACDELGLPIIATGISDSASFFDREHLDEAMANARADMLAWIKRDRNHPSILIWSTENEDQPPIQRPDVLERYKEIDRVFLENDPTRPFVHNGAAVTFARSDVDGWSPILCPHYVTGRKSFGERLHALKEWREGSDKPLILGEEDVAVSERPGGYLFQLMGDRIFGDLPERDALWGWYIKRMVGAWRTYGVGGVIAHSNHFPVANAPLHSHFMEQWKMGPSGSVRMQSLPLIEFRWDDLATPYAKPKYHLSSALDYVNPWLRSVPESIRTPVYDATREAFNPVMVTLARDLAHNYFAGEACAKEVYVINEGPGALDEAVLGWELREGRETGDGRRETAGRDSVSRPPSPVRPPTLLASGQRRLDLPQGANQKETIALKLPGRPGSLLLTVTLYDRQRRKLAADELPLTLYAPPADPNLGATRVALFDPAGRTARVLAGLHVRCEALARIGDVEKLAPGTLLVLGAGAATREVADAEPLLKKFLAGGGKMLVFEQEMSSGTASSFGFVKAPAHPAFRGIASPYLSLWRTPFNNLCRAPLRVAGTARTTVLLDLAYSPALAESRFGSGTLVMSNLELTEGCLQGEPEARIITANLLGYLAALPALPAVRVRYLGGKATDAFLKEALRLQGVQPWRRDEALAPGDVVVVGEDAARPETAADKAQVARFVREGGTVVVVGAPGAALTAWLPEPVDAAGVSAAYLLNKKSADRLIDGLGTLFIMRSERAAHYFVADAIPDLRQGYRLPPGGRWQSWFRISDRATQDYKGLWRRAYYWEGQADAVAVRKEGEGRYILTSLPMKGTGVTVDLLAALFANLNAPSTDTRCFLSFTALAGGDGAPRADERSWRGFVKVDLIPHCNRLFHDEVAGDGIGGWDDSGDNDLRNVPTGDFLVGGVPFHIIDRQRDDPNEDIQNRLGHPIRSCVVLKGKARPQFPERVAGIEVGQKLRKLHFVHTATWCGSVAAGQPVARYVVRYADGTTAEFVLGKGVHIDDWTFVSRGSLKEATVAWAGAGNVHPRVGLYAAAWTNPQPDKEITAIDFVSEGAAIPILVAVTGQR